MGRSFGVVVALSVTGPVGFVLARVYRALAVGRAGVLLLISSGQEMYWVTPTPSGNVGCKWLNKGPRGG